MLPKGFDLPAFIKAGIEQTITIDDIDKVLVPLFGKYGHGLAPLGLKYNGHFVEDDIAYHKIGDFRQFRAYLADNDEHHLGITDEDLAPLDPYVVMELAEDKVP